MVSASSSRSRPTTALEKRYSKMLSPRHSSASIEPMVSRARSRPSMLQWRSETMPSFNRGLWFDWRAALIVHRQLPGHKVFLRAGAEQRPQSASRSAGQPNGMWLAAVHAGDCARHAMDLMYRHGGSTSFKTASRLAEVWRDLQVVGQAATLAPEWYPIGGRAFLGLDPRPRVR